LIFSGDPDYCFSEALRGALGLRLRPAAHLLTQQILMVQALKVFLGRLGVGFQAVERFLGAFALLHLGSLREEYLAGVTAKLSLVFGFAFADQNCGLTLYIATAYQV
jgi:hypothetical protein